MQRFGGFIIPRPVIDMNLGVWPINALDPPPGSGLAALVPGGSDSDGSGGFDNSSRLQAMYDYAADVSHVPEIWIVGRRNFMFSNTVTPRAGVGLRGIGGLSGVATGGGPHLVWNGAAGGDFMDVAVAAANTQSTWFDGVSLMGRSDGNNQPGKILRYHGTGGNAGSIDTGCFLRDVFIQNADIPLSIEGGVTNFRIDGGRIDNWNDVGIYGTGSGIDLTILGNFTMANPRTSNGCMFFDGESASPGLRTMIRLLGLHMEPGPINQVYGGGDNPFDRRMMIRLGVNASVGGVQHNLYAAGISWPENFSVPSHCVFGITATSTADSNLDNTGMVNIMVDIAQGMERGNTDANTTDEIRIFGGRIATAERPPTPTTDTTGRYHLGIKAANWSNVLSSTTRTH